MSRSTFQSTRFYLSVWSEVEEQKEKSPETNVYSTSLRTVCSGSNCKLRYCPSNKEYIPQGRCKRDDLCTELRILKDAKFLDSGITSESIHAVNFEHDIKNWKYESKIESEYQHI